VEDRLPGSRYHVTHVGADALREVAEDAEAVIREKQQEREQMVANVRMGLEEHKDKKFVYGVQDMMLN
jgi:cell division septum initiation protein DivIVA